MCTDLIICIPVTRRNKLVINIFVTFTGRIPQGIIRPVVNMSPWDICITEIYRSLIKLFLMVKSVFPHVASSIPAHCGVYSIQHYVLMFFSDLRAHCWFSPCTPVFSIIKTDLHDITEILLKVALSNISTNKTDCHDITEIVLHVA